MRSILRPLVVVSSILPVASLAQAPVAPTADDYVCALTGECAGTEPEEEAPAAREPGSPRVTATRGFALSRTAPRSAPAAPATTRRQVASRPAQPPMRPRQGVGRVDLRLSFDTGSSVLREVAQTQLRTFAEALRRPQLASLRIRIEGHTDATGPNAYNMQLGEKRAEQVKRYLYEQHQVPLHKMNVISFGEEKPVSDNKTRDGRAQNRRVVIKVLA